MRMKVFRNSNSELINIGEWDYQYRKVDSGVLDSKGRMILKNVSDNPLPADATEDEADIVTGWDGGLYEATDPRKDNPNG